MQTLPHTRSCFVCGEFNPLGLKLRFQSDGQTVQTRFTPRPEHIGFKGVVHGGIVSTLLDEIMVWVCAVRTGHFAFCAELQVRFLRPVQPGHDLVAIAELISDRRGRIFEAKAELKNEAGEIFATAQGKYLPVKEAELTEMTDDFVCGSVWPWRFPKPGPSREG
jgi:uncharacterized protein (TIGR00369 family)